ncbi:uncharacterized protein B0I36DRAFT_254266 [Microdochium trichocladiopsis]|uniref:Rhodopsin domain-containing protein n=1 Tax=Microdochium trichocladiopsis TaxID=1682393 RepID=A0A9P8XSX6_9PEZI|nr:uncharacterized protein B0I36DRAFT_254266 [Microdochium trichocladiopsis]KAH7016348.1 hypothetical protein B0I36DRAFT_254266 [Microdochium trichocladiopsis]
MDPLAPIAPARPGVTPDFYSISSRQLHLSIILGVTYTIVTLLMCLRLYTSIFVVKKLYWDALFLVSSWALAGVFFLLIAQAFPAGFGRHIWDVNYQQLASYLDSITPLAIIYMWPLTCVKLSVLILYHQVDPEMVFRFCLCVAVFTVVPTLVYTGLFIDRCNPLKGDITCVNNIGFAQTGTSIMTDLFIIAMPIYMTMRLNMPTRKKLTVGALLTLSSACVVFPLIRTAYIQAFVDDPDVTWSQCTMATWTILEINVGVICNSLAMLKPFVRHHMPGLARRLFGGSKNSGATPATVQTSTAGR